MVPKRESKVVPGLDGANPEYDRSLFEKLRALRKELADERDVPPYIIFSDASIQQMAYYFPQSGESFASINGVGAQKLAQFSDQFLAVICNHSHENGLVERNIPQRRSSRNRAVPSQG